MSQKPTININTNIFSRINNINKNTFAIFITLLFALVVVIGMHYHIMWEDELEEYSTIKHYLINKNPAYLVYHSLIKVFFLINPTQAMSQFVNSLIIILTVSIFVFYSPFKNIEKFLFAFNYYFVFEYGIIARYYCFMLLILFLIIFLISKVKRNYFLITILIIILATHCIISTIIATGLSLYLILDVYNKLLTKKLTFKKNFNLIFSGFILFFGWLGTILLHYFFTIKLMPLEVIKAGQSPIFLSINSIWNSYIPIPDLITRKIHFHHTNIIQYNVWYPFEYNINDYINSWNILAFIISILILVISISKFSNKLIVLYTFLFNNIIYFIFLQYFVRFYPTNYIGPFFIIFICCYWLYYITDEKIQKKEQGECFTFGKCETFTFRFVSKLFKPMLYIILIAQVFSSAYAVSINIKYKFSLSQDAADYIRQNNLQNTHIMVGCGVFVVHSICAHLDKKMFFVQTNNFEFCWNTGTGRKNYNNYADFNAIVNTCINFTEKQNKKVLLILEFPLMDNNKQIFTGQAMLSEKSTVRFLKSFIGEVIRPEEVYWLYEINKIDTSFNSKRYILDVQGKYKEAVKFLTEAAKMKPDFTQAYKNLAGCYQSLPDYDNALNFRWYEMDTIPTNIETLNNKGYNLYLQGKYKEAVKFLSEAIKLKQDYKVAYFNLADCYNAMHDYDNAIKIMDIRLKYTPDDYKALNNKGFYLSEQSKYKEAMTFLIQSIQLRPNYSPAYMFLADCYYTLHDYDNALKSIDIGLKYAPDDYKALNSKGFYLFEEGKYKEAVIFLTEAIELKPDYSEPYFYLAECYKALHDYDNELKTKNIRLKYAPEDYIAINNKGYILYEQGKYQEAMTLLRETIELKPDYSKAYINLADCYKALHDYDNALKIIDIGLKYAPAEYNLVNNKGVILYNQGKYKEAITFYNEAIKLNPQYGDAYMNIGSCYGMLHDYDNAIFYWRRSLEFNPGQCTDIYKMLGWAYQNKGDRVSADAYYAKAKELIKQ